MARYICRHNRLEPVEPCVARDMDLAERTHPRRGRRHIHFLFSEASGALVLYQIHYGYGGAVVRRTLTMHDEMTPRVVYTQTELRLQRIAWLGDALRGM